MGDDDGDGDDDDQDPFGAFVYTAEQDVAAPELATPAAAEAEPQLQPPTPQNVQRPLWFMEIDAADKSQVLQVGTAKSRERNGSH